MEGEKVKIKGVECIMFEGARSTEFAKPPEGYPHIYIARHADNDMSFPVSLEKSVFVNRWGVVFAKEKLHTDDNDIYVEVTEYEREDGTFCVPATEDDDRIFVFGGAPKGEDTPDFLFVSHDPSEPFCVFRGLDGMMEFFEKFKHLTHLYELRQNEDETAIVALLVSPGETKDLDAPQRALLSGIDSELAEAAIETEGYDREWLMVEEVA